jgi:hypothetical protein
MLAPGYLPSVTAASVIFSDSGEPRLAAWKRLIVTRTVDATTARVPRRPGKPTRQRVRGNWLYCVPSAARWIGVAGVPNHFLQLS